MIGFLSDVLQLSLKATPDMKTDNRTIVKSNPLIMARHQTLSANTNRLWNCILLALVARDKIDFDKVLTVSADDLALFCGVKKKNGYVALQRAAEELQQSMVMLEQAPDGTLLPDGYAMVGYVEMGVYRAKKGIVEFKLNSTILKYLAGDLKRFTHLRPRYMLALRTRVGAILYEHLKMNIPNKGGVISHGKHTTLTFELQEFKEIIGMVGQYKKFYEFKRKVIFEAMDDINKHTDFNVAMADVPHRITVVEITFHYEMGPPQVKESFAGGYFGGASPDPDSVIEMAHKAFQKL